MAQRRMFSLAVVDTDNFLDMPQSTQNLYFHLGMRADDDGFVASPRKIIKIIGAASDDLKLLITKGYIIPFENGVCVITDWHQNNYLQKDRYKETVYTTEKSLLQKQKNGSYTLCIQDGNKPDTQDRLGKDRLGKDRIGYLLPGAETAPDRNPNGAVIELPADNLKNEAPDQPKECAVIELPLNDGHMFPVLQGNIDRWAELYPAVDIMQQLRAMIGWCEANPAKRKTKRGINKFINGWLAREQDRGGVGSAANWGNNQISGGSSGNSSRVQPRYGHVAGTAPSGDLPGDE